MFSSFRFAALFISALATGYGSQNISTAALAPAGELPLKYTALFGGQAHISGIAVHADGSAFVTGTASSALPATAGAFQTDYKPATCISGFPNSPPETYRCPVAFAAKLSHDGTSAGLPDLSRSFE